MLQRVNHSRVGRKDQIIHRHFATAYPSPPPSFLQPCINRVHLQLQVYLHMLQKTQRAILPRLQSMHSAQDFPEALLISHLYHVHRTFCGGGAFTSTFQTGTGGTSVLKETKCTSALLEVMLHRFQHGAAKLLSTTQRPAINHLLPPPPPVVKTVSGKNKPVALAPFTCHQPRGAQMTGATRLVSSSNMPALDPTASPRGQSGRPNIRPRNHR